MGFGTEVLFMLVLGLLLLGPRRVPAILGHIARAKAQLEQATRHFMARLDAAPESRGDSEQATAYPTTAGEQ